MILYLILPKKKKKWFYFSFYGNSYESNISDVLGRNLLSSECKSSIIVFYVRYTSTWNTHASPENYYCTAVNSEKLSQWQHKNQPHTYAVSIIHCQEDKYPDTVLASYLFHGCGVLKRFPSLVLFLNLKQLKEIVLPYTIILWEIIPKIFFYLILQVQMRTENQGCFED